MNVHFRDGKQHLLTVPAKGTFMDTCATFNEKYMCCRVHVLKSVQNCPFECTYCFLQDYLTDGSTTTIEDITPLMDEVRKIIAAEPWRFFRIGTWVLGDSLALEEETGQAALLVREFSRLDNALLELKTKSDVVDPLLSLDHRGRTVLSWSLNTAHIVEHEEHGTASLEKRIEAMGRAAATGYLIGLHFDPMIIHSGWEQGYAALVEKIFKTVSSDRIAWISMGSLRFHPQMKKKIENHYPDSRITSAEMVAGDDQKLRYVKPLRISMYRHLLKTLQSHISNDVLVYLCMERWDVWDRVLGWHPDSIGHLDYMFAESLYERFGMGPDRPEKSLYESK